MCGLESIISGYEDVEDYVMNNISDIIELFETGSVTINDGTLVISLDIKESDDQNE